MTPARPSDAAPRRRSPLQLLVFALALAAGAGLPVQAALNAEMARHAGRPEWATFVSFAVGLVAVALWLLAMRMAPPSAAALRAAPLWSWWGGVIGAFYVTAIVLATPRLGVAITFALALAGQMGGALLLDHAGALGLAHRPITPTRLVGVLLLVGGVLLIRR